MTLTQLRDIEEQKMPRLMASFRKVVWKKFPRQVSICEKIKIYLLRHPVDLCVLDMNACVVRTHLSLFESSGHSGQVLKKRARGGASRKRKKTRE